MRAVHVGNTDGKRLYYLIDLEEGKDGALLDKAGNVVYFDFWSFMYKKDNVQTIEDTEFHKFLWNGHKADDADVWAATFIEKVIDPDKRLLSSVPVVSKWPSPRQAKMDEMSEIATDFRTLVGSGLIEKAIGRTIGRRAGGRSMRAATGGVRGFVRGATFDPNAIDADEDGWVQEGTQFARRASRKLRNEMNGVRRSAERGFSSLSITPLKDRRVPPRFRVKRETAMDADIVALSKTVAALDKKVQDAFNDGKEINTVGDAKRAFAKAVPSFADGTSNADFLNRADDMPLSVTERDLAHVFLLNALNNPNWSSVTWNLSSRESRLLGRDRDQWEMEGVDINDPQISDQERWNLANRANQNVGAWALYRPGTFVEKLRDFTTRRDKSRKARIEISYRNDGDTLFPPDTPASEWTYANRIFSSVMKQLNDGPIKSDAERSSIYQDAVRLSTRSTLSHELGHAAHYIASNRTGRKKLLLTDDIDNPGLDAAAKAVSSAVIDAMSPRQRRDFLRRMKYEAAQNTLSAFSTAFWQQTLSETAQKVALAQLMGDSNEITRAADQMNELLSALASGRSAMYMSQLMWTSPIRDVNGQRVKLSSAQAKYIQGILTLTSAPMRVRSGDDFTVGHAMLLFGGNYQAPDPNTGELNPQISVGLLPMLFREGSRAEWSGRSLVDQVQVGNGVMLINAQELMQHYIDNGLPRLRTQPGMPGNDVDGLDQKETHSLLDALFVHVGRSYSASQGGQNMVDSLLNPSRQATVSMPAAYYDNLRDRHMPDVIAASLDLDMGSDADIHSAASKIMESTAYSIGKTAGRGDPDKAGKETGKFAEHMMQLIGHWDELSTDEIDTARNMAMRSAGGVYGNYMGTWTPGTGAYGNAFLASSAEFFAELTALAHMGQSISVGDKLGNPADLTASEKAVLRKILAWLHPGTAFNLY